MFKRFVLFLDDERFPAEGTAFDVLFLCRNVECAKAIFLRNDDENVQWTVSFDHDLGEGKLTGKDFANWLVDLDMANEHGEIFNRLEWTVHSQNPVGAENIKKYLESYESFKNRRNAPG